MQVSADLPDVVVVLVAAVDRPAGLGNGVLVVHSVDEALAQSQIEPVLNLTDELSGLVDYRLERAEEERIPRVTRIQEGLGEQAASARAKLVATELPVPHLRGPESGGLDGIAGDGPPVSGDDLARLGWTEVNARFTALAAKTEVAGHPLQGIALRGPPIVATEGIV